MYTYSVYTCIHVQYTLCVTTCCVLICCQTTDYTLDPIPLDPRYITICNSQHGCVESTITENSRCFA